MRFLVDNALAPATAAALRGAGYDAVHVRDRGLGAALDDVILDLAAAENRILVSQDTDFSTLLARRKAASPSLILFRRTDKTPRGLVQCLLANLAQIREHLEQGSVVVIEDTRVRVRRLPFVALP